MNAHVERARVLLHQSRHEMAEQELRQALANNPEDSSAHAMLAVSLSAQKKFAEANVAARAAIHQAPYLPYSHYVLSRVYEAQDRHQEAELAVYEAIRLDPEEADYYAQLASIKCNQKKWATALQAAEQGLQLDAENIECTNLRAIALVKLGRKQEAVTTIDGALARDPENDITHANQGWTLLQKGEPVRAMEHFREALRLNPGLEWAREGIIEALKARHLIYRLMLRYFFWISKLSNRAQWGFIIGAYILFRLLRAWAGANPAVAPFVWPVLIFYFIFAFLSWSAVALFNLLLRLNRFGRLALSRRQTVASNWVGACLLGAIGGLTVWLLTANGNALLAAGFCLLMIIPTSAALGCHSEKGRKVLTVYAGALALVGLSGLWSFITAAPNASLFSSLFFLGFFVFSWVANAYAIHK